ncbi:uncharacterized protein LOC62_06G007902 [Vanrija pseudolonga]|uniref:Uncharacterized protein n=1 Tax=Vanrija pseudolonga TaxID=143232 RepID=A0AAF0YG30_9TREE|nr:hypothetical protein LOC62_06G007902 [Vanrija pseudolonga]
MRYLLALVAAFLPAIGARVLDASVSALSAPAPAAQVLASGANNTIPMPPQGIYPFIIGCPIFQLTPTVLGPPSQTWNMTFSEIDSSKFVPGMIGLGQAQYSTTKNGTGTSGASVTVWFVGTGISILGSAGFFDVFDWRIDGGDATNPVGSNSGNQDVGFGWAAEVAWARGLDWGLHNATVVVQTTEKGVVLREVMIQTGIQGAFLTDTPSDKQRLTLAAVDGTGPSTSVAVTGKWEPFTPDEGDTPFPPSGYTVLRTNATGSLRYVLPKNTTYVEVWGSTGYQFSTYSVTLYPPPPFNPPVLNFSASTAYYVPYYML